jgi:hypothetical protein
LVTSTDKWENDRKWGNENKEKRVGGMLLSSLFTELLTLMFHMPQLKRINPEKQYFDFNNVKLKTKSTHSSK